MPDFVAFCDGYTQYLVWTAPLKILVMFCVHSQTWIWLFLIRTLTLMSICCMSWKLCLRYFWVDIFHAILPCYFAVNMNSPKTSHLFVESDQYQYRYRSHYEQFPTRENTELALSIFNGNLLALIESHRQPKSLVILWKLKLFRLIWRCIQCGVISKQ